MLEKYLKVCAVAGKDLLNCFSKRQPLLYTHTTPHTLSWTFPIIICSPLSRFILHSPAFLFFGQGEDPFTSESADPEIEDENLVGEEAKEETAEEVAAEVLAEVITAAVQAVEGKGSSTPEQSEVKAEGENATGTAGASSGPRPEEPQESDKPIEEKRDTEAKAAQIGDEADNPVAKVENTAADVTSASDITEAAVEQVDEESKDVVSTE